MAILELVIARCDQCGKEAHMHKEPDFHRKNNQDYPDGWIGLQVRISPIKDDELYSSTDIAYVCSAGCAGLALHGLILKLSAVAVVLPN